MSLDEAFEALLRVANELAKLLDSPEELLPDESGDPGLPPLVSPAKKAEQHWPTTSRRAGSAPAWPPFSGHRVPLGGDR